MEQVHSSAFGWALHCAQGDREEAADLLHTVYLKVLEKKARFGGRSSFKTWLFSVIRQTSAKRRYRLSRSVQSLRNLVVRTRECGRQESDLYQTELRQQILTVMGKLSARQKQVLHLVFYQDMTIEQAAEVMGVTIGSARTHYERGKVRLYAELEKSGLRDETGKARIGNQAAL